MSSSFSPKLLNSVRFWNAISSPLAGQIAARAKERAMAKITRRSLIVSAGVAAPALLASRFSSAAAVSDFPNKPIRFIIPYAPGGGFDVYVRVIVPALEQ